MVGVTALHEKRGIEGRERKRMSPPTGCEYIIHIYDHHLQQTGHKTGIVNPTRTPTTTQ